MSKQYWKDLLKVSDAIAEKIENKIQRYYVLLNGSISQEKLEEMVKQKLTTIEGEISWKVIEELDLSKEISEAVIAGGYIGAMVLQDMKIIAHFDIKNPLVSEYIKIHTAEMIKNVTEETKQAIREIILRAYEEGGHPYTQARKIREIIGLDSRRAIALENYRKNLEVQGAKNIEQKVERYRKKLLNDRAKVIARNESLKAVNEGQRQAWLQAANMGLIKEEEWERQWVITPDERTCEICRAMSKKRAPLNGFYPGGYLGPPLHIQCRCTEILVKKKIF